MGDALALSRDFGMIRAGELLAFPSSISERASKQISGTAEAFIRNVSDVLDNLVLSVIEKRTAAEFEGAREIAFPQYMGAVLALSSLLQIVISQQAIERLNREGFCELEATLRERGLTAFGSALLDQSMFTVWTLRKISDYMSQIANVQPETVRHVDLPNLAALAGPCMYHAIRTRFHVHCLTTSMETGRPIHPEALGLVIEGLRSVVNAYGLARRLLDLIVPVTEPVINAPEWDDEDQELLREYAHDAMDDKD